MTGHAASGRTPNPALHHVNLKTGRLDEMIAWYGEVVGLAVVYRFSGGAWLTNDGANHRLALLSSPALSDDADKLAHNGLHHTGFELGALDQLIETYERLKALGITPHFCVNHGMTTSFYYADPDGNSVELQVDNFGSWDRSTEFMRSDPRFDADPIGALVDPDQIAAALRAGVGAEEIHERGYAGEMLPRYPMDPRVPVGGDA